MKKKLPNNPNLKSVFTNIVEAGTRMAMYDVFLRDSIEIVDEIKSSKDKSWVEGESYLKKCESWISEYESIVHDETFRAQLQHLRKLEVAILMFRSMASPTISIGEMKLKRGNSDKSYAFVRAPFFSPDHIKNEIRVYMGSMEDLGKSIAELKFDTKFLDDCEKELRGAMTDKLKEQIKKMAKR